MKNSTKLLYGLGFATVLSVTTAFANVSSMDRTVDTPQANNGKWQLEATGVRIIGGYGDNFAYNGENVRWLDAIGLPLAI